MPKKPKVLRYSREDALLTLGDKPRLPKRKTLEKVLTSKAALKILPSLYKTKRKARG